MSPETVIVTVKHGLKLHKAGCYHAVLSSESQLKIVISIYSQVSSSEHTPQNILDESDQHPRDPAQAASTNNPMDFLCSRWFPSWHLYGPQRKGTPLHTPIVHH